jgi:hypothetical protein
MGHVMGPQDHPLHENRAEEILCRCEVLVHGRSGQARSGCDCCHGDGPRTAGAQQVVSRLEKR